MPFHLALCQSHHDSMTDSGDRKRPLDLLTRCLMEHFSCQQQLDTTNGDNKIERSALVRSNPNKVNDDTAGRNHQWKDGRKDCLGMVRWSGCGWSNNVTECGARDGPGCQGGNMLCLCFGIVGNAIWPAARTPKEIEEEYSKRVLWCLNRGYEFISACDLWSLRCWRFKRPF